MAIIAPIISMTLNPFAGGAVSEAIVVVVGVVVMVVKGGFVVVGDGADGVVVTGDVDGRRVNTLNFEVCKPPASTAIALK